MTNEARDNKGNVKCPEGLLDAISKEIEELASMPNIHEDWKDIFKGIFRGVNSVRENKQ